MRIHSLLSTSFFSLFLFRCNGEGRENDVASTASTAAASFIYFDHKRNQPQSYVFLFYSYTFTFYYTSPSSSSLTGINKRKCVFLLFPRKFAFACFVIYPSSGISTIDLLMQSLYFFLFRLIPNIVQEYLFIDSFFLSGCSSICLLLTLFVCLYFAETAA